MNKEINYNSLYASQDWHEQERNWWVEEVIDEQRRSLIITMRATEAINQYANLLNIYNNHQSPYSPYTIWDEKSHNYITIDTTRKFSYIDIESQNTAIPYDLLKKIITENKDTLEIIKLKTFKETLHSKKFVLSPYKTWLKDMLRANKYIAAIYNAFPKRLRKEAFNKTKEWKLYLTDEWIKKLKNIFNTLIGAYNNRSLDSLRDTLWWSTNFAALSNIDKEEDIIHIIDFIDYLLTEGPNRGKKWIFIDRLISLLAFLGDTDLSIVESDLSWLSYDLQKNITDGGDSKTIAHNQRFKDLYSAIQKLISQPDNNAFLSDLSWHCLTHKSKETIPQSIEKQCELTLNYIMNLNKNTTSKYVYKHKGIKLVNKWLLNPDEEKKLLYKLNLNNIIISQWWVKTRTKKNTKVSYDQDVIDNIAEKFTISSELLVQTLYALQDMKTWANGTYEDIKLVFAIDLIDKETKEIKEIGIEIQNTLTNNNNDYNQANHNFLESQKHLLSRIRDKGYTTTKHIYGYIKNSILRNSSDLLHTRNLIQEGKKLESMEWFEEQKIYTSRQWIQINLLNLTNDHTPENKKNIEIIAHDLLLSWLEDGRICIDNNTEEWKQLEHNLYDKKGNFLHIAFRWNNFINNLENSRLQLNTNDSNTKHMWSIIFFPFWWKEKETLRVPTEILWSVIQQQATINYTKSE